MPNQIMRRRRANQRMINVLKRLGLTTSLQLCLDAGDADSYDGSSQTWNDVSGNGNNFYRGTGSGSDASDPTFAGVSGRQSSADYFSHDGGDWFTMVSAPPAWQSNIHKAAQASTFLQWVYVGNLTGLAPGQAGFGIGDNTTAADGTRAFSFSNSSSVQNALSWATNNDTVPCWGGRSSILVNNNAWQMIAAGVTISTDPIRFAINGTTEDVNSLLNQTPSSGESPSKLVIGAAANDGNAKVINGCRTAAYCYWSRMLSAAEIVSIYNATKAKFGL